VAPQEAFPAPSYPNASILAIDDDISALHLINATLRRAGYTAVHLCPDSRRAPELFRIQAPDLVILDMLMPFVSGYELLGSFRITDVTVQILILTGVVEAWWEAASLGASDFLVKPVVLKELLHKMELLLTIRFLRREVADLKRKLPPNAGG
jgi:DNA-binding response OmpR family regulator